MAGLEANGARWPSRSSKSVAPRLAGGLGSTPRRFRQIAHIDGPSGAEVIVVSVSSGPFLLTLEGKDRNFRWESPDNVLRPRGTRLDSITLPHDELTTSNTLKCFTTHLLRHPEIISISPGIRDHSYRHVRQGAQSRILDRYVLFEPAVVLVQGPDLAPRQRNRSF